MDRNIISKESRRQLEGHCPRGPKIHVASQISDRWHAHIVSHMYYVGPDVGGRTCSQWEGGQGRWVGQTCTRLRKDPQQVDVLLLTAEFRGMV